MERELRLIREAADVTDDHVEQAASSRAGEFGGQPESWADTIDRLEQWSGEDWCSSFDSAAIKELKRRVAALLREGS
jgi:hypothetical protein